MADERENGPQVPEGGPHVPMVARMEIVLYADGNWAYEAPIGNLAVCYTLVGFMFGELAAIGYERTHREGGSLVLPQGIPTGPRPRRPT